MFLRVRWHLVHHAAEPPVETDGPDLDFSVAANSQYLVMGFI